MDFIKVSYENDEISGDVAFYRENDTLKILIKHTVVFQRRKITISPTEAFSLFFGGSCMEF
ncbi:hypothetical protein [Moheibacter sediminis]|uniref:Uncharacterized protein n=1 Tax=Moheibacter sediminis TaxID=1434700 RepID=A0A1W2D1A1_9FLAO|nr:hypothetical protein [Moheibacter sediminis]SMC90842.1 hypothetical protein SAMN06296427_1133 [Moheibacter sediminis]